MLIGNNMTGPDLGPVRTDGDHSGTQTGGAYNFIINPETNRRVSIYGRVGKRVIRNYISQMGGKGSGHDVHLPSEFLILRATQYPRTAATHFSFCERQMWLLRP